jgi:hypothetical protein
MTAYSISDKGRPENNSRTGGFLRSRIGVVLICASYVVAFVLVYKWVIVPVWGYEGFNSKTTLGRATTAWILAALPSLWMPIELKRPSQVVYWLLYLLVLVPACLVPIYALDDQSRGPLYLATCLISVFALTGLVYCLPLLPLRRIHLESYELNVVLALLSISFYGLMVAIFGFHFHYVSLEDIYSVRAQFTNTLNQAPSVVAYAINWQAWVINPFVMAIGLRSRRMSWVLAGAAGQLAIYSITGFRSMFFSAWFLLYLLWVTRSAKSFGVRLAATWTAIFAGAGALQFFGNEVVPASIVGERMTALPGLLTGYYYEFFSSHPQVHLGHSIFKSFVTYPYAVEPSYLIGYTYFHDVSEDANANLWADAYANFGYTGIICFTLLLAIVLWLYDSVAVDRDIRLTALVIGLPAFALTNIALLTCLLSNGLGLAMLLVYLMPPTTYESSPDPADERRGVHRRNLRWKPPMVEPRTGLASTYSKWNTGGQG